MNDEQLSASGYMGLAGKTCVVTGAGSGIGRAAALALAGLGADVCLLGRTLESLEETAQAATRLGVRALTLRCDTSDPQAVTDAAARTEKELGPVDVLVNSAGVLKAASLADMTLEQWNYVLGINLTGYFLCSQAFGRAMLARQRGVIVHVASISAEQATPHSGPYSIAKAGVLLLSRQMAVEWGPLGLRSNVVCPGMTWTGMTQAAYSRPGESDLRSRLIPSRRIGQPQEMADAIAYLASDRSAYVNGAELTVDGGFTRNLMSTFPRTAQ